MTAYSTASEWAIEQVPAVALDKAILMYLAHWADRGDVEAELENLASRALITRSETLRSLKRLERDEFIELTITERDGKKTIAFALGWQS